MNDERLNGEGQRRAAEWVRALPEEIPSMAWRAALNERVLAESSRRAKVRWRWTLARPALGFALASALALVLFVPRASVVATPKPASRIEEGLVALHEQSVETADIVGSGLAPVDGPVKVVPLDDPLEDLEAL